MNKKSDEHPVVKFLGNLLDYGPIIVTVIAAFVLSVITSLPGMTVGNAQQWILLILAFLATTQLVDRFRFMRTLDARVTGLQENIESRSQGDIEILKEIPDLRERMYRAKSISLSGLSLLRTSLSYKKVLEDCARSGAKIRILIIDPKNLPLIEMVTLTLRQLPTDPRGNIDGDVNMACSNFQVILRNAKARDGYGLRFLNTHPSYGIWLFDEGTDQAEAWVELYAYQDFDCPALHLTPGKNKRWYDFFQSQYKKMWDAGRPGYPAKISAKAELPSGSD